MKHLGIIGCGWLGNHLAHHFSPHFQIHTTATSIEKVELLKKQKYATTQMLFPDDISSSISPQWDVLEKLDAIIITIPFGKNTDIDRLKNRFENICSFIKNYQNPLFLMSSIGIYPDIEMAISENTFTESELNQNILTIEHLMKSTFLQINILRLGGLMGGSRQLKNYPVKDLEKPVNHIHYEDICTIVETMLQKNIQSKTYNVVAPLHPSKAEVIEQKIVTEIKNFQKSRCILSDRLIKDLDYHFIHPNPVFF